MPNGPPKEETSLGVHLLVTIGEANETRLSVTDLDENGLDIGDFWTRWIVLLMVGDANDTFFGGDGGLGENGDEFDFFHLPPPLFSSFTFDPNM